ASLSGPRDAATSRAAARDGSRVGKGRWLADERMKDLGHAVLGLVTFELIGRDGVKASDLCGELVTYKNGASIRTRAPRRGSRPFRLPDCPRSHVRDLDLVLWTSAASESSS